MSRSTPHTDGRAALGNWQGRFDEVAQAAIPRDAPPAFAFGVRILGPCLTGFATWLTAAARQRDLTRLAFLTREGRVFRDVFDTLHDGEAGVPETLDLIASRRIVLTAGLRTRDDVMRLADRIPPGMTPADWLAAFGGLSAARVAAADPTDLDATRRADLRDVLARLEHEILAAAAARRGRITRYLAASGMDRPGVAVVDIGYAGTVQRAYADLAEAQIAGLYMALERKGAARLSAGALSASSYFDGTYSLGDRRVPLLRFRHLFETVLCDARPSAADIVEADGDWRAVPAAGQPTPKRDAFVQSAHAGAVAFARCWRGAGHRDLIPPDAAFAPAARCFGNPERDTAILLGRLEFEDSLASGRPLRLIEPDRPRAEQIWREGAECTTTAGASPRAPRPRWTPSGPYGVLGWRHAMTRPLSLAVRRMGSDRDAEAFRQDPIGFFRRLSDPRLRFLGRLLYPWD